MTLRLVSEARPIPWDRLSQFEKDQLRDADHWINLVIDDSKCKKPTADEIDRHKSGRVLFINGPRGAGKTSLLLTLLERWRNKEPYAEPEQRFKNLRVLFPILDFDPLPRGMPLHGWLLEPWRKEARHLEKDTGGRAEGKDLRELCADVFERAVLGWSQATVEGKGVVEKALAYQEQASGWVETRSRWYDLVNTAVCRHDQCLSTNCKAAHPFVFVVAIDDVDLQVEQVPHLLHAIRLLHHPNVVYVLTGNMEHLSFVLELDYIRQHGVRPLDGERLADQPFSKKRDSWEKIQHFSCILRNALLEKALPSHATLTLPLLSLETVLSMHASGNSAGATVASTIGEHWGSIAKKMNSLEIATARRAQHAIDKHLRGANKEDESVGKKFIADLCGTELDQRGHFLLHGRLTTLLGRMIRRWEGDRLSIQLREQPPFAFAPQFGEAEGRLNDEDANRVAVIQLAAERSKAIVPGLFWTPDAGVVATQVGWDSSVPGFTEDAIFHWPWLLRPTISEVLEFGNVAEEMMIGAGEEIDLINLPEDFILAWLRQNIKWQYRREGADALQDPALSSLEYIANELKRLCNDGSPLKKFKKDQAVRWVHELVVMTAPYYGLPDAIASRLRDVFVKEVLMLAPEPDGKYVSAEIDKMEKRAVEDAIIVGRLAARSQGQSSKDKEEMGSPQYERAVKDFLETREKMLPEDNWWKWRKAPSRKFQLGRGKTAK